MKPEISIIIPVYNVETYLRECLDSVVAQTLTDWECICVDDGSPDSSPAILNEYAARDKRFHVIRQTNKGAGETRNTGLDAATGNWIVFLDADDILAPKALECLCDTAREARNPDLIRFKYVEFLHGTTVIWPEKTGKGSIELDISHDISMDNFFIYMWEVAYRKEVTKGVRFPRYRRGQDRVFVNTIQLTKARRMFCVDDVLYGYRIRSGSSVHSLPTLQVLRDEMDHRLDIMEMIDVNGKSVEYAGNYWLEGYFTQTLPMLTLSRPEDARVIVKEWRMRLPRLLQCRGLSRKGRRLMGLCSNRLLRPIGDFIVFTLPYLRHKAPIFKPLARLYRRILGHGEFARKEMP